MDKSKSVGSTGSKGMRPSIQIIQGEERRSRRRGLYDMGRVWAGLLPASLNSRPRFFVSRAK